MRGEDLALRFAETQCGLLAPFHLAELDLPGHLWSRLRASPHWDALSTRVLRVRGAPTSDEQRVRAAVLDVSPGGFLHGPSTLAWAGLRGYDLREIHVAQVRGFSVRPPTLGHYHRLRAVRPHDLIVLSGVVTESVLRAIWTEAAKYASPRWFEWGLDKIGKLLDEANRKGLLTWAGLHEMVDDIHQQGRGGTRIMRLLAAARQPGSSVTESGLEDRFEKILADAGVPPLRRQVWMGGHERIGRGDYRDDDLPLAVEVNSLAFHTHPSDVAADKRRYRALNDAGFTVAVMWETDLWSRPNTIVRTLRDARRMAEQRRHVVVHSPGCPWPVR
jgi:hypothetical protein